MKFLALIAAALLLSCGQNSADKKETKKTDTTQVQKDSISNGSAKGDTATTYAVPGEAAVNASLKAGAGSQWHVLNDKEASWMKDAFEYFIVPERKKKPNYPYIAYGDYDADGKADTAAVVRDSLGSKYQLIALMGNGKQITWKEDITEEAAISTVPKSDIEGMDGEKTKKIRMKGDGINVEYFERAAFVLYWDKSSFKRIQTAD